MLKISVILPTYNERENIVKIIPMIHRVLSSENYEHEIIVVDDNSPDGTAEVAEKLSHEYPCVKVIKRIGKRGLSTAILEGVKASSSDIVVVMDADLQHPPDLIPVLVKQLIESRADIVVASRYVRGGSIEKWSVWRELLSRIGTALIRLLIPGARKIKDPLSGFFAAWRNKFPDLSISNPGFKILLQILAYKPDTRVIEVPFKFSGRMYGESKLSIRTIVMDVIEALRLSDYRPIKFALVGAIGLIVNLSAMYLAMNLFMLPYWVSSLVGIETSVISNYTLHELWTFRDRVKLLGRELDRRVGRLLKFHGSSAASISTTFATTLFLVEVLGLSPYLGQFIGIVLGYIANYVISEYGVWA